MIRGRISQGRVSSDNLTVDLVKLPIVLSGWTDFDGRVNYRVRTDNVIDRLPSQARDLLADPAGFRTHLERYAASVIVTVTYGRRVEDVRTDEVVRRNAKAMERLTSVK